MEIPTFYPDGLFEGEELVPDESADDLWLKEEMILHKGLPGKIKPYAHL
jgi:hypothetical protein